MNGTSGEKVVTPIDNSFEEESSEQSISSLQLIYQSSSAEEVGGEGEGIQPGSQPEGVLYRTVDGIVYARFPDGTGLQLDEAYLESLGIEREQIPLSTDYVIQEGATEENDLASSYNAQNLNPNPASAYVDIDYEHISKLKLGFEDTFSTADVSPVEKENLSSVWNSEHFNPSFSLGIKLSRTSVEGQPILATAEVLVGQELERWKLGSSVKKELEQRIESEIGDIATYIIKSGEECGLTPELNIPYHKFILPKGTTVIKHPLLPWKDLLASKSKLLAFPNNVGDSECAFRTATLKYSKETGAILIDTAECKDVAETVGKVCSSNRSHTMENKIRVNRFHVTTSHKKGTTQKNPVPRVQSVSEYTDLSRTIIPHHEKILYSLRPQLNPTKQNLVQQQGISPPSPPRQLFSLPQQLHVQHQEVSAPQVNLLQLQQQNHQQEHAIIFREPGPTNQAFSQQGLGTPVILHVPNESQQTQLIPVTGSGGQYYIMQRQPEPQNPLITTRSSLPTLSQTLTQFFVPAANQSNGPGILKTFLTSSPGLNSQQGTVQFSPGILQASQQPQTVQFVVDSNNLAGCAPSLRTLTQTNSVSSRIENTSALQQSIRTPTSPSVPRKVNKRKALPNAQKNVESAAIDKIQPSRQATQSAQICSSLAADPTRLMINQQGSPAKEEERKLPRFITNTRVLCPGCGTASDDLHICDFCKRSVPECAKIISNGEVIKSSEAILKNGADNVTKTVECKSKGGKKQSEECITISSDDEDQPKAKMRKLEDGPFSSPLSLATCSQNLAKKENLKINFSPSPPSSTVVNHSAGNLNLGSFVALAAQDRELDMADLIRKIEEEQKSHDAIKMICRSVRVGDYKCTAPVSQLGLSILVTNAGIVFTIPHAQKQSEIVKCAISKEVILNIDACFKRMPVFFFTTGPKHATAIRKCVGLGSDAKQIGLYYDPLHGDECQQKLIFIPDVNNSIQENHVGIIKKIFGKLINEIDYQKANNMLISTTRSSTIKNTSGESNVNMKGEKSLIGTSNPPSAPSATPAKNAVAPANSGQVPPPSQNVAVRELTDNKTVLIYQEIEISQQDILYLADEQFVNDSILDFWLRYIEYEFLTPEERSRTYIFSTFFYKRLTTKGKKDAPAPDVSPAERRHNRVMRWTKNVDIFEKDFVIVPINESLHWFLAVICYPGLIGFHNMETGDPIENYVPPSKSRAKPKAKSQLNKECTQNGDDKGEESNTANTGSSEQNKPDETPPPATDGDNETKPGKSERQVNIKRPCIIVFDSLCGESHSKVYSTLRDYLRVEWKKKKGTDRLFNKDTMPGGMPSVPQQPNSCDCGLFTLFYVERFFRQPIPSYDFPMHPRKFWLRGVSCDNKRKEIYDKIRELIQRTNPEALSLVPQLEFAPPAPRTKPETNNDSEKIQTEGGSSSCSEEAERSTSAASGSVSDHDYAKTLPQ